MWLLIIFFITPVLSAPCDISISLNITSGNVYENGSRIHEGVEYKHGTWYEVEVEGVTTIYGCPCIEKLCVWKCCGPGEAYLNRSCSPVDFPSVLPFNPPLYKGRELLNVTAAQRFFFLYHHHCEDRYLVDSSLENEYLYLQENGTLYEIVSGHLWHEPSTYCVDMMSNSVSSEPRLVAAVCYPEVVQNPDDDRVLYIAYATGLLLSVPFLMATFLVYAIIPELRNLHGMCLMSYCGGLIIGYLFLAYLKLHTGKIGVGMGACYTFAFIVYYSFQSSFFWLNVMCFDIWRTFSSYRGGSSIKRREKSRFALYGLYAWGVPVLLTACSIGMQFGGFPPDIITPGFGLRRCWFENWLSELIYFFSPVLVLVMCNLILFSVTAHRIRSIKQETAILKSAESARSDKLKKDKQRFSLYLKLFMVMGVNWIIELISFIVGGSNWYWIVVDVSNMLLGLFIFLIFVWKNKVRTLLRKRWRSIRGTSKNTTYDPNASRWTQSSGVTEDTRMSADESAIRLKEVH